MERKQEILMKIYWKFWISADFSNDFQEEFPTIYKNMKVGNHYSIPESELEKSWIYLQGWERKNIFKNF